MRQNPTPTATTEKCDKKTCDNNAHKTLTHKEYTAKTCEEHEEEAKNKLREVT